MPTDIVRKRPRPIAFFILLSTIFVAALVLEVLDPAPIDVGAATIASP